MTRKRLSPEGTGIYRVKTVVQVSLATLSNANDIGLIRTRYVQSGLSNWGHEAFPALDVIYGPGPSYSDSENILIQGYVMNAETESLLYNEAPDLMRYLKEKVHVNTIHTDFIDPKNQGVNGV